MIVLQSLIKEWKKENIRVNILKTKEINIEWDRLLSIWLGISILSLFYGFSLSFISGNLQWFVFGTIPIIINLVFLISLIFVFTIIEFLLFISRIWKYILNKAKG